MRKNFVNILSIAAVSVAISCGESNKKASDAVNQEQEIQNQPIPTEPLSEIEISASDLQEHVSYLASDELKGRATGTPGIEKAAQYLERFLSENDIQPYFKSYRDSFSVDGKTAYNVVGFIEGTDPELKDEFVILGAHYDHVGQGKEVDGDLIANGANDNASGTAALMEVAEYFSENKNNKRSLIFSFFSAEELGLKGADHLANRLKKEDLNLYTMLNFEMLGIPMQNKEYEAYLTGYEESNLAHLFNLYAGAEVFGKLPKAEEYNLFMRSDNYPFYREFNVPAQTFSTFDFTNYDYYHHVEDEAPKMNYEHMANLVENVIPGVEKMTQTAEQEIILKK